VKNDRVTCDCKGTGEIFFNFKNLTVWNFI
jgi:hypothetical protein